MAITVRRVEADDLDQLRLHQSRPELGLVDKHFSAMNQGRLIFAVALDGAAALGTALLDFESGDLTPELRNMYVYPSARRMGAGRALSSFLERTAREAGYSAVYPRQSPGGWYLLGRTGVRLWDETADRPALLAPGTLVRFAAEGDRR